MQTNTNPTIAQILTVNEWDSLYPDALPRFFARVSQGEQERLKAVFRRILATMDFDSAAEDIAAVYAGVRDTVLEIQVEKIIP